MKKLILGLVFFLILEFLIFPLTYANEGECAFEQGPCGDPSPRFGPIHRVSLESLIKQGAMYFFDSNSYFNTYLKEFEIDNFTPLQEIAAKAFLSMRSSNDIYLELNQECMKYNYNQVFIRKLKNFDYDEYCEEYNLIRPIFRRVKRFLSRGDVRGALKEILKMNREIAADLESLQFLKGIPDKQMIWRINQKYMESKLFGQYLAEVFCQIVINNE